MIEEMYETEREKKSEERIIDLDVQRKSPEIGKLIVVEGIDGSGKSTQLHLLKVWLTHLGLKVYDTGWNSSELVKKITSKGKKKALLTPTTFSLLHATDFADRYELNVYPLLKAGYFVLADRYIYILLTQGTP